MINLLPSILCNGINLTFLITRFSKMNKRSIQELKYLQDKNSIKGEIKSTFHHLKVLSEAKNYLIPDSTVLKKDRVVIPYLYQFNQQ